jgi:hypothetical protein
MYAADVKNGQFNATLAVARFEARTAVLLKIIWLAPTFREMLVLSS